MADEEGIGKILLYTTPLVTLVRPEVDDLKVRVHTLETQELPFVRLATMTAKGDLLVGTAASAVKNLAVGANGSVLIADNAQSSGVRWGNNVAAPFVAGAVHLTQNWSNTADAGNSEISNDTSSYKQMMLVGNSASGVARQVGIWDQLQVGGADFNQTLNVNGAAWVSRSVGVGTISGFNATWNNGLFLQSNNNFPLIGSFTDDWSNLAAFVINARPVSPKPVANWYFATGNMKYYGSHYLSSTDAGALIFLGNGGEWRFLRSTTSGLNDGDDIAWTQQMLVSRTGNLTLTGGIAIASSDAPLEGIDNRKANALLHMPSGYVYGGTSAPYTLNTFGNLKVGVGITANLDVNGTIGAGWSSITSFGANVSAGIQPRTNRLGNWVMISGSVTINAAIAAGATLFTLPGGFRPSRTTYLVCAGGSFAQFMQIQVASTGVVSFGAALGSGNTVWLDGIWFPTD
ncbi:MAG: hypothetical protein U0350_40020 [Caldilineaceae bacterium]